MNISEYRRIVDAGHFNEYPFVNGFTNDLLCSFLKYEELDYELNYISQNLYFVEVSMEPMWPGMRMCFGL